jgi:hypothetical protein
MNSFVAELRQIITQTLDTLAQPQADQVSPLRRKLEVIDVPGLLRETSEGETPEDQGRSTVALSSAFGSIIDDNDKVKALGSNCASLLTHGLLEATKFYSNPKSLWGRTRTSSTTLLQEVHIQTEKGTAADTFVSSCMKVLEGRFRRYGHEPSKASWVALRGLFEHLWEQALGVADPFIHLASLDPGEGKTEAAISFLQALLSEPSLAEVSVLVAVERHNEIESLVRRSELDRHQVCVLTSDQDLNELGQATGPEVARVLFTTHEMVRRRVSGSFSNCADFHFKGRVREVRIWDEGIQRARELSFDRHDLVKLIKLLSLVRPDIVDLLESWSAKLYQTPEQGLVSVPDFGLRDALKAHNAERRLSAKDGLSIAKVLDDLSNCVVGWRKEGRRGVTLIDFKEWLPSDISPLLVLDASGRVRETYKLWPKDKATRLRRLTDSVKDYSPLVVRVWKHKAGRDVFDIEAERNQIAEAVAALIRGEPDESWLIVTFKLTVAQFEAEVRKSIGETAGRVSFITWGQHVATNDYTQCRRVILAGVLRMTYSGYELRTRAARGVRPADGPVDEEQVRAVEHGELKHDVFQAICRSHVRVSYAGRCGDAVAYIICPDHEQMKRVVEECFPGCKAERWHPFGEVVGPLSPQRQDAYDFLLKRFEEPECVSVPFKLVREYLDCSKSNFTDNVVKDPQFSKRCSEAGIGVIRGKFIRIAPVDKAIITEDGGSDVT